MNAPEALNAAIRYIEENLCGDLDEQEAARIACVTLDSLARFFSYMTGMTLKEYVRKRRLTLAAFDLQQRGDRVIDVALRYGYDSADAFARAFAKQHGMTPAAARRGGTLRAYPPASFHIIVKGAKQMNVRIIEAKDLELCGISEAFDGGCFPSRESLRSRMWDADSDDIPGQLCEGRWNQPGNHAYDGEWYGLWRDGRYMIGREQGRVQRGGLERQRILPGKYAAFATEPGGLAWEELPRLFESIFDSWLPTSGYALRSSDIVEVYHLWTDREERRQKRYYEVWIPVDECALARMRELW